MNARLNVLFLLLSLALQSGYAQSDISYRFEVLSGMRHSLEWRKPISEKLRFTCSIYYAPRTGNNYYSENRTIYAASDTLIQMTNSHYWENAVELRLGAQRNLRKSVFSVKTELQFGYLYAKQWSYLTCFNFDPAGYWYPGGGLRCPGQSLLGMHYVSAGGTISLCADIPLSKRFILSFQWSNIARGMFSPVSKVLFDDLDMYTESMNQTNWSFDLDSGIGIGLRCKLGKPGQQVGVDSH